MLSDHAYPMSLDTLVNAADTAAELGMPLVMGEVGTHREQKICLNFAMLQIGWKKAGTEEYLEAVESLRSDGRLAGSLLWSMFGHAETFGQKISYGFLDAKHLYW